MDGFEGRNRAPRHNGRPPHHFHEAADGAGHAAREQGGVVGQQNTAVGQQGEAAGQLLPVVDENVHFQVLPAHCASDLNATSAGAHTQAYIRAQSLVGLQAGVVGIWQGCTIWTESAMFDSAVGYLDIDVS